MKLGAALNLVLRFGYATGILPFTNQWSSCRTRRFHCVLHRVSLATIYEILILSYNALSNLDISLHVKSAGLHSLSRRLYRAANVNIGYFADFWIRFYMLLCHSRVLALLRKLCFIVQSLPSSNSTELAGKMDRTRTFFVSVVLTLLTLALVEEIYSSCSAWPSFENSTVLLQFIPRISTVIKFTLTLNNLSRGSSLAFACALPLFVLLKCTACYSILTSQLDELSKSAPSGGVQKLQMKQTILLIGILKTCLLEINELNSGLLLPLVLTHATTVSNVPFAIVTEDAERGLYCGLFLISIAILCVVCVCGRFISLEVQCVDLRFLPNRISFSCYL